MVSDPGREGESVSEPVFGLRCSMCVGGAGAGRLADGEFPRFGVPGVSLLCGKIGIVTRERWLGGVGKSCLVGFVYTDSLSAISASGSCPDFSFAGFVSNTRVVKSRLSSGIWVSCCGDNCNCCCC